MSHPDKKGIFLYYWNLLGLGQTLLDTGISTNGALNDPGCCEAFHPVPEYRFFPGRMWRFDWAFPELKVAVEVEGGAFVNGAHNRGAHFIQDCEKYNTAASLNWLVFRFTPDMLQEDPHGCIMQVSHALTVHDLLLKKLEVTHATT